MKGNSRGFLPIINCVRKILLFIFKVFGETKEQDPSIFLLLVNIKVFSKSTNYIERNNNINSDDGRNAARSKNRYTLLRDWVNDIRVGNLERYVSQKRFIETWKNDVHHWKHDS